MKVGVVGLGDIARKAYLPVLTALAAQVLDVQGPDFRHVVHDIATVEEYRDDRHAVVRRGDWTSVQRQRGFEDICDRFISAVANDELLDPEDALRTHDVCEQIVRQLEA